MAIQDEIKRLGGIEPLEGRFIPLDEAEINNIEQTFSKKLPEDYRLLLATYGAFVFTNSVEFKPINQAPEYIHAEELDMPIESFSGSGVATVYGKGGKNNSFDLLKKIRTFRERMPDYFLPFADDGLGNQLCLALDETHYQKVYWWDHELEWDAEDYEEETGEIMPEAAKFQNVYLIANSLTEFFEKLTVSASA